MRASIIRNSRKVAILAFWLLIWHFVSVLVAQEILIVSPVSVFVRLTELAITGAFWVSALNTLTKILTGFALAVVFGVVFGFLAAHLKLVRELLSPPMSVVRSTPVASFTILALVWFKAAYLSVVISFLMVVPVIYFAAIEGVLNVDKKLLEMTRVFRLSPWVVFKSLTARASLPFLLPAAKTGMDIAWKSGVAAEIIGLPSQSIGMSLYNAKILLNTADLFAWTAVVIILSRILEHIFGHVVKMLAKAGHVQ